MPNYKTKAIVLKKTKLKEKDLILTLLAENGSQIRCVAYGAQKPGSTYAARLEVLSEVDLLLNEGKNLDTVSEAKVIQTNEACRRDLNRLSYGSIIAELMVKSTLEGQEIPVIYQLTCAALASLGRARDDLLGFVTAAYLIKAMAYMGYKPSFDECVICGAQREEADASSPGIFSISDGGWVCSDCAGAAEAIDIWEEGYVDMQVMSWVRALLGMTFAQIEDMDDDAESSTDSLEGNLLDFCGRWVQTHMEIKLKTLDYLSCI